MQYLGLQKILTLISTDPSDLIINRYVSLVTDMQNEQDKADSLLNLATIMLDIDPQETLKYALPVFEHNQSLDALQLIYKAVLALGKDDKALVIKREIQRLKNLESSKQFNNTIPTKKKKKPDTTVILDDESQQQNTVLIDGGSIHSSPTEHLPPNSIPTGGSYGVKDTLSIPPESTHSSVFTSGNPSTGSISSNFNVSNTGSISRSNLNNSRVSVNIPTPSTTPSQRDSVEAVLMELFDFYWKNGLSKEAGSLLNGCQSSYSNSPWWLARMSLIDTQETTNEQNSSSITDEFIKNQIANIQGVPSSIPNSSTNIPLAPSSSKSKIGPVEIKDQFWNYLNILIKENNNRKALFYIRQELSSSLGSNHSMEWAKKLYPTLNSILEKLEYKKIKWNSKTENENDLFQKILSFIPQKISSIVV